MSKTLEYLAMVITSVLFFLFGNNAINIQWLCIVCIVMIADLYFGTVNAIIAKTFQRRILLIGFERKIGELFVIALAHMIDTTFILSGAVALQVTVTGFFLSYEILSVLNKLKINGVPIPDILINTINKFIKKDGGEDGK